MELTQITEGPIGLGTRIRRRNRHLDHPVEGEMEIVEWTPGEVMGARIHDANMDTEGGASPSSDTAGPYEVDHRGRLSAIG
jgi:hypothetical protein